MISFTQFVKEALRPKQNFAAVFQAADEADDALHGPAARLIDKFIGGTKEDFRAYGMGAFSTTPLERAYTTKSTEYREIEKAFGPVKVIIHEKFGDKITLFRSERTRKANQDEPGGRVLLSYTSNPDFAEAHAAGYKIKNLNTPTQKDADEIVTEFRKNGSVTISWNGVGKKKIVRDPDGENQDWALVMDGDEVEFGDLIQDIIDGYQRDAREWLERTKNNLSMIIVEDVPLDDIIWVTNRARQSEFIVINRPRTKRKYLNEGKSPYWTEWGWLKPDGEFINGKTTSKATYHCDLVPKDIGQNERSVLTTNRAIVRGWVRFGITHENEATFEFVPKPEVVRRVIDFILDPPVSIPANVGWIIEIFKKGDTHNNIDYFATKQKFLDYLEKMS